MVRVPITLAAHAGPKQATHPQRQRPVWLTGTKNCPPKGLGPGAIGMAKLLFSQACKPIAKQRCSGTWHVPPPTTCGNPQQWGWAQTGHTKPFGCCKCKKKGLSIFFKQKQWGIWHVCTSVCQSALGRALGLGNWLCMTPGAHAVGSGACQCVCLGPHNF